MKKIILVFFLAPLLMKAQDSISSPRLGLTFGFSLAPAVTYGWAPGLSFSSGKHEAYTSLLLVNALYPGKTLPGFLAGYRFYPDGHATRFSLVFLYDFAYFSAHRDVPYEENYY